MVDPALALVHAGKGKIGEATAEKKEEYRGGQSRIHFSSGGHSDPKTRGPIVNEETAKMSRGLPRLGWNCGF
jgi:hypothetical protein